MATTLLHAITFLLNPLPSIYSTHVLDALHVALLSNLSHSESHSLFLAPNAPPPQPIAQALRTVPVNWDDWVLRLTRGNILVLAIDLQRGTVVVAIRNPATSATSRTVLWDSRSNTSRANSPWGSSSSSSRSSSPVSSRVVTPEPLIAVSTAENVLKEWDTVNDEIVYPSPRRHAKSASTSVIKPAVHDISTSLATLALDSPPAVPSDSEEDEPCYIDKTKDQAAVTEYECGKVGVLTGAVMLGVPKNNAKAVKHQPRRSRHAHSHSVTAEFSHLPRI